MVKCKERKNKMNETMRRGLSKDQTAFFVTRVIQSSNIGNSTVASNEIMLRLSTGYAGSIPAILERWHRHALRTTYALRYPAGSLARIGKGDPSGPSIEPATNARHGPRCALALVRVDDLLHWGPSYRVMRRRFGREGVSRDVRMSQYRVMETMQSE
jgi:hypothetical protein